MKTILSIIFIVGLTFLSSCGKDAVLPQSLENTYWKSRTDDLEKIGYLYEISFSSDVARYSRTRSDGETYTSSEPYTYDPLSGKLRVRITVEQPSSPPVDDIGIPGFMEGRVNSGVLTLGLWETFDLIQEVTLYKQ